MSEATTGREAKIDRPLSPHLQIYRPLINMVMSILHRITGAALYFGTIILAAWLVAAASGPVAFQTVSGWLNTWAGWIVLFGYTWALMQHMLGGLRHFMWDMGHGYEKNFSTKLAMLTPVVAVALTVLIWVVGYLAR